MVKSPVKKEIVYNKKVGDFIVLNEDKVNKLLVVKFNFEYLF